MLRSLQALFDICCSRRVAVIVGCDCGHLCGPWRATLARCQPTLMNPTGCRAGLPGNSFAFACKQRPDPPGLFQGREGEEGFAVCGDTVCVLVCETF